MGCELTIASSIKKGKTQAGAEKKKEEGTVKE